MVFPIITTSPQNNNLHFLLVDLKIIVGNSDIEVALGMDTNTFNIRLKEILREKKMTQRQLAELTGLRPSTISSLCKNQVDRIYLTTLAIICAKLDISIDQLLVMQKAG